MLLPPNNKKCTSKFERTPLEKLFSTTRLGSHTWTFGNHFHFQPSRIRPLLAAYQPSTSPTRVNSSTRVHPPLSKPSESSLRMSLKESVVKRHANERGRGISQDPDFSSLDLIFGSLNAKSWFPGRTREKPHFFLYSPRPGFSLYESGIPSEKKSETCSKESYRSST